MAIAHYHLALEITTCRLTASGPRPQVRLPESRVNSEKKVEQAVKGYRQAYFAEKGGYVQTPVYDRYQLGAGLSFEGPAIVEERDSTAVIGPDATVTVDRFANLIVLLKEI